MRLVILESPYAPSKEGTVEENVAYARKCLRDCLLRGEAPIASHLLYTQSGVLDDTVPEERALGIEAGLCWGRLAQATVVYTDRGISPGMAEGIERAKREGRSIELRSLRSVFPTATLTISRVSWDKPQCDTRRVHELKTWPEPFAAILGDRKRFEIRQNDRGFAVGDVLVLREWKPPPSWDPVPDEDGTFTGRKIHVVVTYIVPGGAWDLPTNLCVMSIRVVDAEKLNIRITNLEAKLESSAQTAVEMPSAINQREATIARMRPVVDAACAWERTDGDEQVKELMAAVRAYQTSEIAGGAPNLPPRDGDLSPGGGFEEPGTTSSPPPAASGGGENLLHVGGGRFVRSEPALMSYADWPAHPHDERGLGFPIEFIINGEDVVVTSNPGSTLADARDLALEKTHNRRDRDWEVRAESGQLLDVTASIASFGFRPRERLFITLLLGAGGSSEPDRCNSSRCPKHGSEK